MVCMCSVFLALFIVLIAIWLSWRKKKLSVFKELGIPGPEPNILFGNVLDILKKNHIECEKEWIQKYGKVFGYYYGTKPVLKVADVDIIKNIMVKDFHKFADRPRQNLLTEIIAKNSLIFLKGKSWKQARSIISPSFTASKLKMITYLMHSASDSLMDIIEAKSKEEKSFNIQKVFQGLTMDVIGRTAFGIQTDVQNNPDDVEVLKASKLLVHEASGPMLYLTDCFPEIQFLLCPLFILFMYAKNNFKNPFTQISQHVKGVIEHRRKNPNNRRQDLLQTLMDSKISQSDVLGDSSTTSGDNEDRSNGTNNGEDIKQSMSDVELVANAILFLLAGYETTNTSLAFTVHQLVHHPEVQEKIRNEIEGVLQNNDKLDYNAIQELKYLEQVITESLRLYFPVTSFIAREASQDVEYGRYKIKKGITVEIAICSLSRNPELWENPNEFNPDRFSAENKSKINSMAYQTFGQGPRNCVGQRFAYLEMKLALAKLLHKYKLIPSEETEKVDKLSLSFAPPFISLAKGVYLKVVPV